MIKDYKKICLTKLSTGTFSCASPIIGSFSYAVFRQPVCRTQFLFLFIFFHAMYFSSYIPAIQYLKGIILRGKITVYNYSKWIRLYTVSDPGGRSVHDHHQSWPHQQYVLFVLHVRVTHDQSGFNFVWFYSLKKHMRSKYANFRLPFLRERETFEVEKVYGADDMPVHHQP